MRIFVIFLACIFVFIACKKKIEIPLIEDYSSDSTYFGLTKGNFIEYDVVHITHDDEVDIHDTLKFKLKTLVGDTFVDNQGRIASKFIRYTWNDTNDTWVISDVWSEIIDGKNAEQVDENQRLIKLSFPIKFTTTWNPSILTTNENETYIYTRIHSPLNLGNFHFDSTITVLQKKYFTLVDYQYQTETYAKKIGLISKYYKDLRIKNFDTLQVIKGEEWFYTLTKYGKE